MTVTHRLANIEDISYEQVIDKLNTGGRFVVFQYTISLIGVSLRRLTPAYFVAANENPRKYARTANLLTLLFGWWCIPWGPYRTIQSLKLNLKGGTDVTKDILINLSEADYSKGIVNIVRIDSPFFKPGKSDEECLRKAIGKFIVNYPELKAVYFALYVNVPDGVEPYFVIALPPDFYGDTYFSELKVILYKYFYNKTTFEFLLENNNEFVQKLVAINMKVSQA